MTSLNRKKRQRRINAIIRQMNRAIWEDELWKGRFYARQVDRRFYVEDDYLYGMIQIELVDRETGKCVTHYFRLSEFTYSSWHLWEAMNDFIVVHCHVWETEPRITRATTIDYRGCHKW